MKPRAPAVFVLLSAALSACPERPATTPAVDAAADVSRADARAATRRRRRSRRPRAQRGARAPSNANPAVDNAPEPDETDEPAARMENPETGRTLREDLGPPPETTLDMTQGSAQGPMGLSPSQVSRAMDPLLPRCQACAAYAGEQGHEPHGRVTARLRVRNDGHPLAARVSGGGGDPRFILCVRRVVAAARFASFAGPDVFVTWGFDVD